VSWLAGWFSGRERRLQAPTLADRSAYKATWQRLAGSADEARTAVAGYTDEEQLEASGRHTVEVLDRLVGIKAPDVALEIGCGVGRVGKVLSPRCARWIGTDISRRMLDVAAERLRDLPNVELVELGTVGLGEIPDASVDLVYCTVVFMHLFEWDRYRYVQEAHRVLRSGGRCFFDNVDITSDHGWKVFMDGFSVDLARRPAHLSMTSTGDELSTYAVKAGFRDVRVHRWDDAWVGVTGIR
jgi:ubiquinone/menaquinone biosynthesis C-methylase UbiE